MVFFSPCSSDGAAGQGGSGPVAQAEGHADLSVGKGTPSASLSPQTGCGACHPPVGGSSLWVQHHLTKVPFANAALPPPCPSPHCPCQQGGTPIPNPTVNETQAHFLSVIEDGSRGGGRGGKRQNMFFCLTLTLALNSVSRVASWGRRVVVW